MSEGRLGHEGKAQALLVELEENEHFWGVMSRRSSFGEGGGGGGMLLASGEYVLPKLMSK